MAGLFVLGGSSYYSLLLIDSLASARVLERLDRIALFGRNEARLALIAKAATTLTGGAIEIEATTRIEDCQAAGYDLLFNQMRFGGLAARDGDERLATEIGLPADETIGIVGVSNAVRALLGMAAYLPALQAKPGAFTLVNFTNPCSILCQYLIERLPGPVIGICDYPAYMRATIAEALGAPPEQLEIDYFGLNHFGLIHGARLAGRDVFDRVRAAPLAFRPACNAYSPWLLNISWAFVHERAAIVARQRAAANRAATLLAIEAECDALAAAGERDPRAFLALLGKRRCDWFNLAVTPVLARLLGMATPPLFVNCAANDPFELGLERTIVEASWDDGAPLGTARFDRLALPPAVRRSAEFQLIALMKAAERRLLEAVLARDGAGVIAACLANPMIAELAPIEAYFARLRESDPQIAGLWAA